MADTLQSLGLLKPDFTTLPPDIQDDPGAFVNLQAYVDALRGHDALQGGGDQPPIDFRQQAARVLQAYGDAQGQGQPTMTAARKSPQPPAAPPVASPSASRHRVPQPLPDAFPGGVTGPLIRLSDPHFDDRVRQATHNRPSVTGAPRGNSPPSKSPEQPWYKHGIQDGAAGLLSGALSIPETAVNGMAWLQEHPTVAAALGVTTPLELGKAAGITPSATRSVASDMDRWARSLAYDPDSMMFKGGDLVGSVAPTFLVPEAKLVSGIPWLARAVAGKRAAKIAGTVAPWATRMGAGLARYGDMSVQSGIAGALSSHGQNIAKNATTSAALAPILGAAVDKFLPPLASASDKAVSKLRDMFGSHASPEITPASYIQAFKAGTVSGNTPEALALQQYAQANGPAIELEYGRRADAATRAGPGDMKPISPQRLAASLTEARRAAAEFKGRPIVNGAEGVTAVTSGRSLEKMTSVKSVGKSSSIPDHSAAVANADHLYRGARLIDRYPDPRGEPTLNISRWRNYMDMPDGLVGVKMLAKESSHPDTPNPLYTLETIRMEGVEPRLSSSDRDGVWGEPARTRFSLAGGSDASIAQSGESSNDAERLAQAVKRAASVPAIVWQRWKQQQQSQQPRRRNK